MSTKSTLWHNEDLHFYREVFDDNNLYLAVRARSPYLDHEFILKIPLAAWKEMREHTIEPNESYLDLSDAALRAEAERRVDEHRADLDKIRRDEGHNKELRRMGGIFLYGSPDSSREEMIERFLQNYRPTMVEAGK